MLAASVWEISKNLIAPFSCLPEFKLSCFALWFLVARDHPADWLLFFSLWNSSVKSVACSKFFMHTTSELCFLAFGLLKLAISRQTHHFSSLVLQSHPWTKRGKIDCLHEEWVSLATVCVKNFRIITFCCPFGHFWQNNFVWKVSWSLYLFS